MIELIQLGITLAAVLVGMGILVWFVLRLSKMTKAEHQRAISALEALRKWLPLAVISRFFENQGNTKE